MRIRDLPLGDVPEPLLAVWGDIEFTSVQERAVAAGLFNPRRNLLVVAPTSSGKTLIGEMAAVANAYRTRRHSIFIVPFRALADEQYAEFRSRYGHLLSVVISTGDWTEFDDDIRAGNFGLAVLTYEKFAGLLVEHAHLLERCVTLVVDEVQMLGDMARGPGVEMTLTRLLQEPDPRPQLIALSASIDRTNSLDKWLNATSVIAHERPVPLEEGVLAPLGGTVLGATGRTHEIQGSPDQDVAAFQFVAKEVAAGRQVLYFRTSVPKSRQTAERLMQYLPAPGTPAAFAAALDELEPTDDLAALRATSASLVAFHNADLATAERRAVEEAFRRGEVRVIVATPTLAVGVNLPTDVVVIGDTKRFSPERGQWRTADITVAEYKNAAGRAGRLGQRTAGRAVIVAAADHEQQQLFDFYCRGSVDAIESRLPGRRFDDIVFNVVASGLAADRDALVEFLTHTFAYATFWGMYEGVDAIRDGVERAVRVCLDAGLIADEGRLVATPVGHALAVRSVPVSVSATLAAYARALLGVPPDRLDALHAIADADELFEPRPFTAWDRQRGRVADPREGLFAGVDVVEGSRLAMALGAPPANEREARNLLRAACLTAWTSGQSTTTIAGRFAGSPATRVRGMGRTAAWLLDAVAQVALIEGAPREHVEAIRLLSAEARYGVPAELAPLAALDAPGVGRDALIRLYHGDSGRRLFDPDVFLDADTAEFQDLLRPIEVERIRAAIVAERGETFARRRDAHLQRAQDARLHEQVIRDLYEKEGIPLEVAIADALTTTGITVEHLTQQHQAQEDLRIWHAEGVIVASVTASESPTRRIKWSKVREVFGTGAGLNPQNYLCIGRPSFDGLSEKLALEIARETGERRLLLVPVHVLADAVIRIHEKRLGANDLVNLLAVRRGVLTSDDFDAPAAGI